MPVSRSGLRRFKKMYQKKFGEELCDAEALSRANYLLNIYLAVYGHPLRGRQEVAEAELQANIQQTL